MIAPAPRWALATLTTSLGAPDVVLGVELLGPVQDADDNRVALVLVPGEPSPRWVHVERLGAAVE